MTLTIDMNADLGEDESTDAIARDIALMQHISSCNIACGGHAGSPKLMAKMLGEAEKAGINAGAHPSYPDRKNFGRVSMDIGTDKLCTSLIAQVTTIIDIARIACVPVTHIKPHGALYNDLADDPDLAGTVTAALHGEFPELKLVGLAQGEMQLAARRIGAEFIAEAFIDRCYTNKARLLPRSQDGAVLTSDDQRIAQALSLARDQKVTCADGEDIEIAAQSLCIHSDSDGALVTAQKVSAALARDGVKVAAP